MPLAFLKACKTVIIQQKVLLLLLLIRIMMVFHLQREKAQIGPRTDSDNMIIPTIAEGVVLAPIVINIKPKPI